MKRRKKNQMHCQMSCIKLVLKVTDVELEDEVKKIERVKKSTWYEVQRL
jgi:hypothetical protein